MPGHLAWDMETLARELPEVLDHVDRLIEQNFQSDIFVSPQVIDHQTEQRLQAVLRPRLIVQTAPQVPVAKAAEPARPRTDPFS
jgi:hypothetical protein